jgi:hypothetical protein
MFWPIVCLFIGVFIGVMAMCLCQIAGMASQCEQCSRVPLADMLAAQDALREALRE